MEKNKLFFYLKFVGGGVCPKCEIVGWGGVNLNLLVVPLNFMGVLPPGNTFFWCSPYPFGFI
jgi:hypothetical protein